MEHNGHEEGGTRIRPIPPPLEFPFPQGSDDSSISQTTTLPTTNSFPSNGNNEAPLNHTKASDLSNDPSKAQPAIADTKPFSRSPHDSLEPLGRRSDLQRTVTNQLRGRMPSRPVKKRLNASRLGNWSRKPMQHIGKPRPRRESDIEYSKFSVGNDNFKTKGKVDKTSGRLDISINETANRGYLAKALGASFSHGAPKARSPQDKQTGAEKTRLRRPDLAKKLSTRLDVLKLEDLSAIPVLNIVIMVIGSRGDIRTYISKSFLLYAFDLLESHSCLRQSSLGPAGIECLLSVAPNGFDSSLTEFPTWEIDG